MNSADTSAWMSVADVAAHFHISVDLVYHAIARGELPAVELGRRKLVPRRAVDALEERAMDGYDPDRALARLRAV